MARKISHTLGSIASIIYFIFPMSLVIFAFLLIPLTFYSEVHTITQSGFAGPNSALPVVGMCSFFAALSLLIPPLRRMYHVFPWLYPYIKIFLINAVILSIALAILNYGYEVVDPARHTLYLRLMIAQLVLCRLGMSVYFHFRPAILNAEE